LVAVKAARTDMSNISLTPTPPFDLRVTALHQTYYQSTFGADAYLDGAYIRALEINGLSLLAVIRATGTTDSPSLSLEITGDGLLPSIRKSVAESMIRMLSLELDLRPFYAKTREDPLLYQATQSFYGLHPPQTASMFEALVMAIIGQQISGAVARTLRIRTVQALGNPLTVEGGNLHTFPNAAAFMNAGHDGLRALGHSNRKTEYILDIAARAADGQFEFDDFARLSNAEVTYRLTQLRGVGAWTAQWVMLRALGRTDPFPAGDLALQRVISQHYFDGRPVKEADAAAFGRERWGEYAGLATTYLFAYIRTLRIRAAGQPGQGAQV
jgi:DNA-3-methyladenine glycosylase II